LNKSHTAAKDNDKKKLRRRKNLADGRRFADDEEVEMSGVVVDTGAGNVRQRRQLDTVARLHTTLRRSRRRRWHMTQNRRLNAHKFCTTVVIHGWRRRSVVRTSVFAGSLSLTCAQSLWQWRRLHGHGRGTCPPLLQMAGHGGHRE